MSLDGGIEIGELTLINAGKALVGPRPIPSGSVFPYTE